MDSLYFNLNKGGLEIQVRNKPEDMIIQILGRPLGHPAAVLASIKRSLDDVIRMAEALKFFPRVQSRFAALRFCLLPKVVHLWRTTSPDLPGLGETLESFQTCVAKAILTNVVRGVCL